MSLISEGPEAQNEIFEQDKPSDVVPAHLTRATFRLQFPPSYVIVGVYRLCTDKLLFVPVWQKCRNGTRRGVLVGLAWTALTFKIQRKFLEVFLSNSPRVTGLSNDTVFGYKIPFNVHTYAAFLLVGSQVTYILRFFLARNIRIACDRVWEQTVASRGYSHDFWQPYVEEWSNPPVVTKPWGQSLINKLIGGHFGRMVIKRTLLLPFNLYPVVGIVVSAWFKGLDTGKYLHTRYFSAKKMTPQECAVFVEERKWDYRTFGFTAALLEGLPFVGLFFAISNRVGAAMWAHDLEKRQHFVKSQQEKGEKILELHGPVSVS